MPKNPKWSRLPDWTEQVARLVAAGKSVEVAMGIVERAPRTYYAWARHSRPFRERMGEARAQYRARERDRRDRRVRIALYS